MTSGSNPNDPRVLYRRAVALALPTRKRRSARDLQRARTLLTGALRTRRSFAAAQALLAYIDAELNQRSRALRALRIAVRLEPRNRTYRRFLLELLDHAGLVRELGAALAAAARIEGVDLASLRAELKRAGLPADASTVRLNAFPAGKAHFESELIDAEDEERRADPTAPDEMSEARAARRAVRIDGRKVPQNLREAIDLARKWGIPDDAHRARLTSQISGAERKAMRKVLSVPMRRQINAWLDSFADAAAFSPEATHFLYLLEAFDELFQR